MITFSNNLFIFYSISDMKMNAINFPLIMVAYKIHLDITTVDIDVVMSLKQK